MVISNTHPRPAVSHDTSKTITASQQVEKQKAHLDQSEDEKIFLERVRCYLNDPTQYLPSVSVLDDLSEGLTRDIHEVVRDLLDNTYTPADKSTQLGASLSVQSSKPFTSLCCGIYGVTTEEELMSMLTGASVRSQLGIEPFLRTSIAAATHEWVLQGQHSPLPRDLFEMSGIASVYSDIVCKGKSHEAESAPANRGLRK